MAVASFDRVPLAVPPQPAGVSSGPTTWGFVSGSVEPQFRDVARVPPKLAALDFLNDVDEPLIGARLNPNLLPFAHHIH